jgi:phage host-nuclease inhibitor protein Gam
VTRKKALAVDVPATLEQAKRLAADYATLSAEIDAIEAERKIRIAQVNKDCDERIAARRPLIDVLFAQLKGWWEAQVAQRAAMRSARVAGIRIGHRMTPPALKLPRGTKPQAIIDALSALRDGGKAFKAFVRVKYELDREAMIKALRAAASRGNRALLERLGLSVTQRDEFFIEPLPRGEGSDQS